MIESIEGKRGLPRHRPPYVAQVGLFGRPTLEQNVETLFWIRDIIEKGAEWMTSQGRQGAKVCVASRCRAGSEARRRAGAGRRHRARTDRGILRRHGRGHGFKGYLPGGASGGILPASMADIPLDFGTLEKYGCFVGSHAVVILSDQDDMKAVALNLMSSSRTRAAASARPAGSAARRRPR